MSDHWISSEFHPEVGTSIEVVNEDGSHRRGVVIAREDGRWTLEDGPFIHGIASAGIKLWRHILEEKPEVDDIQERQDSISLDTVREEIEATEAKRKERLKDLILVQANLHWVAGYFEGESENGALANGPISFLDTPLEIIDEMIREEIEDA